MVADDDIDGAWQASWGGDQSAQIYRAEELAAHYGTSAVSAVTEVRRRATCHSYTDSDGLTLRLGAPLLVSAVAGVEAAFGYCEALGGPYTRCTVLMAHGHVAAALRVTGSTDSGARTAIARLAPLLGDAIRRADGVPGVPAPPTASTAAPSLGNSTAANGDWTLPAAQGHFQAMIDDARPTVAIERDLGSRTERPADVVAGITFEAGEYANRLPITVANLEAGRWPVTARSAITTLVAAMRGEQAGFAQLAKQTDLSTLRSQYTRLKPAMSRTDKALRAVRIALHLPES